MTLLFIQSILVYSALAFIMFLLAKNYSCRYKCSGFHRKQVLPWEYWCIIIIFAIVAGLRWDVGIDHLSYLDAYLNPSSSGKIYEQMEPAFKGIIISFNKIGLHFFFFFAFCAAVQMAFVILSFRKNEYIIPYIVLLIVLGPYFLNWMNGIRQCMVTCSFIWAVSLIKNKKFIPYIIWCLVSCLFHKSALILIPFFLFAFSKRIWGNKYLILTLLFVCIIIGSNPIWMSFLNSVSFLPELLGYDEYASDFSNMLSGDDFRELAWGPAKIGILLTNIFIIFYYNKVRKNYSFSCIDLYYKFSVLGALFYYLFCNTSHLFLRPISYFTIFLLPMTAFTLEYLIKKRKYTQYFILIGVSMSYTFICCLKAFLTNSTPSTLYQFFIFR